MKHRTARARDGRAQGGRAADRRGRQALSHLRVPRRAAADLASRVYKSSSARQFLWSEDDVSMRQAHRLTVRADRLRLRRRTTVTTRTGVVETLGYGKALEQVARATSCWVQERWHAGSRVRHEHFLKRGVLAPHQGVAISAAARFALVRRLLRSDETNAAIWMSFAASSALGSSAEVSRRRSA